MEKKLKQDLRPGNWVWDENDQCVQIDQDRNIPPDCKPIPLLAAWLIDFGAVKVEHKFEWVFDGIGCYVTSTSAGWLFGLGLPGQKEVPINICRVEHVHHLQNLVWDIRRKELIWM